MKEEKKKEGKKDRETEGKGKGRKEKGRKGRRSSGEGRGGQGRRREGPTRVRSGQMANVIWIWSLNVIFPMQAHVFKPLVPSW